VTRPTYLGDPPSPQKLLRDGVKSDFDDARVVFTGETTTADMFAATFRVDEVWKGTVPQTVTIKTSAESHPDGTVSISSCDRTFANRTRYLVYAHQGSNGEIVTGACTPAYTMDRAAAVIAELDALAPRRKPISGSR
jgi:hypothetical protein